MDETFIYILACIWGTLDKIGDDAIDIYNAKHGTFLLEFAKILRVIIIITLLYIPKNIWLYIFIFIYSYAYATSITDEYLSDNYVTSSCILFTILSAGFIYMNRNGYSILNVLFCWVVAFSACIGFVPDGFISLMELWKIKLPTSIQNALNEEVGETKVLIRCAALNINIIIICLLQLYIKTNDLRIAATAFCLAWICYYRTSVINQVYNLYFNPNYTTQTEKRHRTQKNKQVKQYDPINMMSRFQEYIFKQT